MRGHYKKVPDSSRIRFPEPRKEANQYKEPIGPTRPSTGSRILTAIGDFNRAIAPHVEQGRETLGKVQRGAARRSSAINSNFGIGGGGGNLMNMGRGWMGMRFDNDGFGPVSQPERRPRKRKRPRQREPDGLGWGMY